jgi:hypothetical protein
MVTNPNNITITNASPDQTVALNNGTGINVTGTYPTFTIANTLPSTDITVTQLAATHAIVSDSSNPTFSFRGLEPGTGIGMVTNPNNITITNTSLNTAVALTNLGGTSLVSDTTGPGMTIRGLTSGSGISLTQNLNDIQITNTSLNTAVALTNLGGTSIVSDTTGPGMTIRGLTSGSGISLTQNLNDIQITNSSRADQVTLASGGGSQGLVGGLVGDNIGPGLVMKGLNAGTGISLSSNSGSVTIGTSVILNAGGSLTLSTGNAYELKGITAGTGISIDDNGSRLQINASASKVYGSLQDNTTVDTLGEVAGTNNISSTGWTSLTSFTTALGAHTQNVSQPSNGRIRNVGSSNIKCLVSWSVSSDINDNNRMIVRLVNSIHGSYGKSAVQVRSDTGWIYAHGSHVIDWDNGEDLYMEWLGDTFGSSNPNNVNIYSWHLDVVQISP